MCVKQILGAFVVATVCCATKAWADDGPCEERLKAAEAAFFSGNYSAAIQDFTKAVRLDRERIDAYLGRGVTYVAIERNGEAIADFNRVLRKQPEHPVAIVGKEIAMGAFYDSSRRFPYFEPWERLIRLEKLLNPPTKRRNFVPERTALPWTIRLRFG